MISISNVSYSIRGEDESEKKILNNINLQIENGMRLAIMGRNGSGKTTLAHLIAGLILPSSGEVRVNDISTGDARFQAHLGKTVGIVFQNPEHQIVTITVEREIALGLENYGYISEAIHHNVDRQLAKYDLAHLRKKTPNKISGGEKQKLALASVMVLGPEILILDEPMSHLDSDGRATFKADLEQVMQNKDVTVIYVTQDLSEIADFERVIILDGGKIAEDCAPSDLADSDETTNKFAIEYPPVLISEHLTSDKLNDALTRLPMRMSASEEEKENRVILECREIAFAWRGEERIIDELDLALYKGKIHGLLGRIGCGKSTLALLLGGLLKRQEGDILINGNPVDQPDLVRAVAYIFQSPERGLFAATLYEDIMYGPKNFGYSGDELKFMILRAFEAVGLDFKAFKDRSPHTLSGGEARLAGIAGGLAADKEIIILDEPTEELDHSSRLKIIDLIEKFSSKKRTTMLISHDSDFLFEVCDYIGLWIDKKVRMYSAMDLYDEPELFTGAGTDIPLAIQTAMKFKMVDRFRKNHIRSLRKLSSRKAYLKESGFPDPNRDA